MTYTQTYDQGPLFMNYMNAKTYLKSHRDDRVPSFALAPCSSKYITEGIRTQEKSRCIILVTSESVLFVKLTPVNYSDGSGHFPILLGMILIGAAVGAFMASGARAFAVGFGSGFVSTATRMSLQNAFEGTNYSADRILGLSLINGFASGAIAMLPSIGISGITTGRNSFGAISASITKKYVNATIRNMALKTMGKKLTYNLVTSAFDIAWGGFTDATGFDDSVYDFWRSAYEGLHI